MGFLFRTIFWLGLAAVILPPEARLGGDEQVEFRDIDVGLELHNAAYSAWAFATQAASTCEGNPELCGAAAKLWDTTTATVLSLGADMQERGENLDETAEPEPKPKQKSAGKIQARVE